LQQPGRLLAVALRVEFAHEGRHAQRDADGGDAMYVIDQVRDPDGEDSWISGLQFRQTVAGLTPREKRIMELRFGLRDGVEHTQKEVADSIGISQSYISRLEKRIIKRLRQQIESLV